jgi:hypothetical protein
MLGVTEMSRIDRADLAVLWHRCAQIRRSEVFSEADVLRPTYNDDLRMEAQVDVPAVGTVGRNYAHHGIAFVSVNPAGGKPTSSSTVSDDHLYDAFRRVRDADTSSDITEAFESMVAQFGICVPSWTIWRQYIGPILGALNVRFDDVCYLYLVPFRTRGDAGSSMSAQFTRSAYEEHLERQLSTTRPTLLVAVDRPSETYCRLWAKGATDSAEVFYYTRKRDAHAERQVLLTQLARYAK